MVAEKVDDPRMMRPWREVEREDKNKFFSVQDGPAPEDVRDLPLDFTIQDKTTTLKSRLAKISQCPFMSLTPSIEALPEKPAELKTRPLCSKKGRYACSTPPGISGPAAEPSSDRGTSHPGEPGLVEKLWFVRLHLQPGNILG